MTYAEWCKTKCEWCFVDRIVREKTAELQEELRCITNDRDSWREQSRGHNCNLIKSRARISELEREIAELRKDKADLESLQAKNLDRFYWLFGSPDEGASRDDIEKILMHSVGMEEALAMIDTAMQSAGEQNNA